MRYAATITILSAILLAGRPLIEEDTVDPAARKPASEPIPPPPDQLLPPDAPRVVLPDKVTGGIAEFITVTAVTNGIECRWVAMDKGLNVFPSEQLKDSRSTVVTSNAAGNYRLLAYTALGSVPSHPATTMVVVLHGGQPPPNPQPQPEPSPEPEPPPTPAIALWVITVDAATIRSPQVAAVLGDAALWSNLTARGHHWRKMNASDPEAAKYANQIATNGGVPVVILLEHATAKWLNQTPADLKFPATSDGMQTLISKYTTK
jgi:hypothetical protein